MQTKLTLRLDDALIKSAKAYARKHGKSVSQLVGDYFTMLDANESHQKPSDTSPMIRSLQGVLKGHIYEKDYDTYLEEKYLGRGNE